MGVDIASPASAHRNAQQLVTYPSQQTHCDISSTSNSDSQFQDPENHSTLPSLQIQAPSGPLNLARTSPGRRVVSVGTSIASSGHPAQLLSCPAVPQPSFNPSLLIPDSTSNRGQNSNYPIAIPTSIGKPPAMHSSNFGSSSQVANSKPKHMCKVCGKVFKRAHNLKIHGRLHNGDRPYGCPFPNCNKEFRWKSSIVSHVNWHRTKRGDTLPPDAIVVQKTTSRRQLAPFLKPSTTNADPKSFGNEDSKKCLAKDCVSFIPRCMKSATASTSSSDATEHEVLKLPSNVASGGLQGNGLQSASETLPFCAISSNLEMQLAREQTLPAKQFSDPQLQNFPEFDEGTSSQVGPDLVQDRLFSANTDDGDDFVDQLVERNLTLSSQEEIFIDEYVNGDLHGRLDMAYISPTNAATISGEVKSDPRRQDGINDEQPMITDGSTIVTPSSDSFEIFPSTKSTDLEEGTLGFFNNEEWDERHDIAATEGFMAGLLLHPGGRVEGGAELLTGSLEEEL